MKARKLFSALLLVAIVAAGGIFVARSQQPVQNIDPGRHPNLAAAQRFITQAYEKINAAQGANEWDMNGHAARAKQLLDEASQELKAAAMTANRR